MCVFYGASVHYFSPSLDTLATTDALKNKQKADKTNDYVPDQLKMPHRGMIRKNNAGGCTTGFVGWMAITQ